MASGGNRPDGSQRPPGRAAPEAGRRSSNRSHRWPGDRETVDALRVEALASGKQAQFEVFLRYDIEGPDQPETSSYAELAAHAGVPVTQVTNWLAGMRRRFRALVLERLRALSGSDAEYRVEAREILGIDPP